MVPNEISVGSGFDLELPPWVKASIALAASPLGFTSLSLHVAVAAWRANDRAAALLFVPNWLNGFLITILASSVSSLVGVHELVGRCNTIINATGSTHMIAVYLYAATIFFVFCSTCSVAVRTLKTFMSQRLIAASVG